jgi:Fe-S cluster assembly protein SufB
MTTSTDTLQTVRSLSQEGYKYGFVTDIEADEAPQGLDEDTIRFISAKKEEPDWLLEWRLTAFRAWLKMTQPNWAKLHLTPIDYQAATYYSAPKKSTGPKSLDEVEHPELVRRYLGTVVPQNDNFFAALNSAVFSDGSFAYVPPGVRCPMELSTYFRINAAKSGQFERTLLIADAGSYVSYLEGCTAPQRDENQLHAAVVELIAHADAQIKYSTVQNWYPGDAEGRGGIYNFVTKRGACRGARAKISWTQVETGSAITWKYPSCVLEGDHSVGEFYSVAITNNRQQADTGTKMIHIGKDTRSTIVAKGISAGRGQNTYRGLVRVQPRAEGARNNTQCDSLLIGERCGAHTVPYIEVRNPSARVEHEATTSKISEDQLFYCRQRGLSAEDAVSLIVNGFCKEVLKELPMEFAVEAQKLLAVSLEGSVG